MKFVGVTRFNVVTSHSLGSFRATRNLTLAEAKQAMFESEKLDLRMRSFENFCYPTYRLLAECDSDSHGIVLISHDLPQEYRTRMRELCDEVPGLVLVELADDEKVADVSKDFIQGVAGDDRVFSYRFDDDDALPFTYLSRLRRVCEGVPSNTVVSFNRGYSLSRIEEDAYTMPVRRYPLNAFGLGICSDPIDLRTIFELGPHAKISEPVIHVKDEIGWLATMHQLNDSRIGEPKKVRLTASQVMADIAPLFPQIEHTALQELSFRRSASVDFPDES